MSRALIVLGVALVLAGILWPWLGRLGLGHLPGDITIKGEHVRFYFPLATGLLISVAVSLLVWLFRR
jgi:hypothetical protein